MAQFPPLELTAKGENMIIRSSTGRAEDQLIITKARLGDGILGNTALRQLTDIIGAKLDVAVSGIEIQEGKAIATFIFNNKTLDNGFYHREVGIFAKNGTAGEEALLAYSNAGNFTSYIPSKSEPIPSQTLIAAIGVSNAQNVKLSIEDSGVISPKQLEAHNTSIDSHQDIRNSIKAHKEKAIIDHPDGCVTTEKLRDGAVTATKIASGVITKEHLASTATGGSFIEITFNNQGLVLGGTNSVSQSVTFLKPVNHIGPVTATTPSAGDNTQKVATTAFVTTAIQGFKTTVSDDIQRALDTATAIEMRTYND